MNILKNFEAVFILAVGVAFAAAGVAPDTASGPVQATSVATPSQVAVVTVSAKRMSALEKQRSLEDERRMAKQGAASESSI